MSVLSLTNFTGGEISPLVSGRTDMAIYSSSCARMENFIPLIHGPAVRRSGLKFIGRCRETHENNAIKKDSKVKLIPYSYSVDNSYILEFGHKYLRIVTEDGYLTAPDGGDAGCLTPYSDDDIFDISFAQAGKNLYLAHKNHEPRIVHIQDGQWFCDKLNYSSEGLVINISNRYLEQPLQNDRKLPLVRKVSYAISSVDKNGRETSMGDACLEMDAPAKFDYENYVHLTWAGYGLDHEYFIYRIVNDVPAYVGRTKNTYFNDMGLLEPNYTKLPPKQLQSFSEAGNHPSKVAFFDGRLVFAASDNEPNAVWGSVVGDYSYFAAMNTPTDSCAWKFSIDSGQVNRIQWFLPASKLLIGTAGAEWRMSGNGGGTITANSVEARRETAWGSSNVRALIAGQEILFVDRSGKNIRTFQYANESAGYRSSNLTVYGEHLTRHCVIKDWDYAPTPHSIIWAVTDDGQLLGLTYNPDQRVVAWHRHSTDGIFESVAVMSDKGRDCLFVVVKREIDDKNVRYIEMMEQDFAGSQNKKMDNAFFLDSGLTYEGEATKNISGLKHLVGKTVDILADGAVHPKRKVSLEGTITLDYEASIVHVGLQYNSVLETMPIESMLQDGVSGSRSKRISEIAVRLENTVGLLAGTDKEDLIRIPFRDSSIPMGSAPALFTGDKKIALKGGYDPAAHIVIVQDQPTPMTIVALFPRVRYAGS